MPAQLKPKITREELPSVATVRELAKFARCDERTIRKALAAGEVPGAFQVGRSWRVCTDVYLAQVCRVLDGQRAGSEDEDV